MSGISTKGVKKSYISKEIKPGNCIAKINNLTIETLAQPRDPKNPEYKIFIELETKPIGGEFVGFDKVFGDPSKGQYLGQTKKIQMSDWPIKDNKGISKKTGKQFEILASAQILEFLQKLLTEAGAESWLEDNDGKFDTWTQLFSGIVRSGILKDKYFSWCIAATESVNAKGYTVYYMYLPNRMLAQNPFAIEGGLVTKFDPAVHIKKDAKATENKSLNEGVDEAEDNDVFIEPSVDDTFDTLNDEELFDLDDE
jgi:hypothetical protein